MQENPEYFSPYDGSLGKETTTLGKEVFEKLRADILRSHLKPDTKLRFQDLRDMYGVGLSPLREALSRLAENRLVIATGQRGFRVTAVSLHDILDISLVRKEIESLALRLTSRHGDDAWEARVVAAHHRMVLAEKAGRRVNDEVWEKRHREFHHELVSCCCSPCLLHIHQLLSDQFDRYRRLSMEKETADPPRGLIHQEIVDAMLSRKADLAISLMMAHIDNATKSISAALAESESHRRKHRAGSAVKTRKAAKSL